MIEHRRIGVERIERAVIETMRINHRLSALFHPDDIQLIPITIEVLFLITPIRGRPRPRLEITPEVFLFMILFSHLSRPRTSDHLFLRVPHRSLLRPPNPPLNLNM